MEKDLKYYINRLSIFRNRDFSQLMFLINVLYEVCPQAVYTLLLREIAIDLDEIYPDHILESDELFAVSKINTNVIRISDKKRNEKLLHRKIALFRSKAEANYAIKLLEDVMYVIENEKTI